MSSPADLQAEFATAFNRPPDGMVRAPGRVNVIGEHTDYNNGFVLPCALTMGTIVIFRVRDDAKVRVRSSRYPGEDDEFDLSGRIAPCRTRWMCYVRGVFSVVREYGFPLDRGLDLWITGDLPPDIGLASSAALAEATVGAVSKGLGLRIDKRSLALIGQRAEHDFLGNQCGIMDQLTAVFGREDHLMLIDCKEYSIDYVPLPDTLSMVIMDSRCRRELAASEYNKRRDDCNRAAGVMGLQTLREATLDRLYECKSGMDEAVFRRARHVITENDRTRRTAEALKQSNPQLAFKLMGESHESLKNDFEVTVAETDALVEYCRETLYRDVGVKMTGGGFGGCVVAICEHRAAKALVKSVGEKYMARFNRRVPVYICRPGDAMKVAWFDS